MALSAQELQAKVNMRPTLLIGIGGSGQKVLVNLKARFLKNYGDVPPAIEFLCFDTDQAEEQVQMGGEIISLTRPTQLVNIGGVQVANILRRLDINPTIAAWMAEDKEHRAINQTQALTQGARQVRPLGRVSFFYHATTIANKIKSSVARLTDMKLRSRDFGFNVFIISSVCGGTGSSCFIDMAYLVRHLIQEAGVQVDYCQINGAFVLPSAFQNVDPIGIQSNAYAALRELDYFVDTGTWKCTYNQPVGAVSFQGIRPFNICYLIDSRNERGQGLAGMDEIAPMVAEAIYLQISSQVGSATRSVFDNVYELGLKVMNYDEDKQKATAYSSLGTASLVFPASRIIELCAQRLGSDLIRQHILQEGAADKINERLTSFMQSRQLEAQLLLDELARDSKKNILKTSLVPSILDTYKTEELFAATKQYCAKADTTLDNDYTQLMESNRRRLMDDLTKAIVAESNAIMDDSALGPNAAFLFLTRLDERLSKGRQLYDTQRVDIEQKRNKAQAQLRQTEDLFTDSFKSMNPFGKAGRIKDARDNHITMFQNYLTGKFETKKRENAIALLANLSLNIQSRRAALQNLINRLNFIQAQFQSFVERSTGSHSRTDFVLAEDVTTDKDINRYYEDHLMRLGALPSAPILETKGPLHTWIDIESDEITVRILGYCRELFDDIKQITLEQIITEKRKEIDPRTRLAHLIEMSIPFWSYQVAGRMELDQSKAIKAIGVNDKENSTYKDALSADELLTSTFDKHTITVLQTKHGVPLFALTLYNSYKDKHDLVLKQGLKPLYVFPEVRPGGEKAKQFFALGLAYGFIFKSGVYYNILPEDVAHRPIQLGQGMADSLQKFRSNDDYIALVVKQVEAKINTQGTKNASEVLTGFIDGPYIKELKGGKANKLDPDTMVKDTSINRPESSNYDLVLELRECVKTYIQKVLRG